MKKLTFCAIAFATLVACQPKQTSFVINGTVSDSTLNGNQIYLVDINENKAVDSVAIADCKFSFTGELAQPAVRRVQLGRTIADVILDNSTTANIALGEIPVRVVDNGGYNDQFSKIAEEVTAGFSSLKEVYDSLLNCQLPQEEIAAVITKKQEEVYNIFHKAIDNNKDNILGGYLLMTTVNMLYPDVASLDSVMAVVPSSKDFAYINKYRNTLYNQEATKEGKMFVDFDGKNVDGTEARLSDYVGKGKYILADFWASWCGPCRREIPNLIELQNKFGGDKFTVLGINVWDRETEFKTAMENEKMNYPQLYASDDQEATELYGIQGIPQIILFAPDGTIVKRNLRGEAMKKLVAEELAK